MAAIANASKRGRRTIYTYFKSKEDVYDAVIERELQKVIDDINKMLTETDKIIEQLHRYIEIRLNSIINFSKNFKALRTAFLREYSEVEKIRNILDVEEKKVLSNIIRVGQQSKIFVNSDVDSTVQTIIYLIRGAEFILIKENDNNLTKEHIANVQKTLLNGLIVRN